MEKKTDDLMKSLLHERDVGAYLRENAGELTGGSLAEYLNTLLVRKKCKKSDAIAAAGLDRVYGYQLFSGKRTNPARDKLLCLAFGMALSVDEAQALLRRAEKPGLYPRDRRDSLILFALKEGKRLFECNTLLEQEGEPLLEG